jgi:hypothetical protein
MSDVLHALGIKNFGSAFYQNGRYFLCNAARCSETATCVSMLCVNTSPAFSPNNFNDTVDRSTDVKI